MRVVREDPARKGLLYAGTEAGMFVSFDDGASWQTLKLNLPPVPITDLAIRQDTLVAATQGRGFWTLDDLFMVRTAAQNLGDKPLQIFAAEKTVNLVRRGWRSEDFEAENPDSGVALYYYLEKDLEGPLTIEILDRDGASVRLYSSEEGEFERCLKHNEDPRSPYEPEYPSTDAGLNKWNWDTRREGFHCVKDMTLFAGLEGANVPPGQYTARIRAGADSQEVTFTLEMDPRYAATPEQIRAWVARLDEASDLLGDVLTTLGDLRKSRTEIAALMADYPQDAKLQATGQKALDAIDAWDHQVIQPLHETVEDEDAWETMLAGQIRFVLDVIDDTGAPVAEGTLLRLADLTAEWAALEAQKEKIQSDYIGPINAWARDQGVLHVRGK